MYGSLYFQIFGLTITYYSICIFFGIIAGYTVVLWKCKDFQIEEKHIDNLLLFTIPSAIIGARIYHIFAEWDYYKIHTDEIFALRLNGLGIFGAIVASFIVFVLYARLKKINIWKLLDLGVYGLLAGQVIGRFGNFFNKELYGYPTNLPWKIFIPLENREIGFENYEYFHPTFLYESIWNLVGLMIVLFADKVETHCNASLQGKAFSSYLIWYGLGRFLIGFLRIEPADFWIFNDGQVFSLVIICIGVGIIFNNVLKIKSKNGNESRKSNN